MYTLPAIRDTDLGLQTAPVRHYTERTAARAIIFDANGDIALLHNTRARYHKLPGGGVEAGEDLLRALHRETREEVGCVIENIRELASLEEYRDAFAVHQTSFCYLANLSGQKGTPQFTQEEQANGFEVTWLPLSAAIDLMKTETNVEDYEGKFINARDLAFLQLALTSI